MSQKALTPTFGSAKSSLMNQTLRFGLVGCGRISNWHVKAIKALNPKATLVALCDTDPQQLKKISNELSLQNTFSSLSQLLASQSVDIVSLCTPSGLHPEQAINALEAGVHVISEKPMALALKDAKRMIEASNATKKKLFVVKQNRLNPTTVKLKEAIDSGRFGKIYSVICNVLWSRPQDYYDQAPWRGTRNMDGGVFLNQASHYVDLLSYLFGQVSEIQAFTATLARNIECEDTGSAAILWKSGAIGSINVSMLVQNKNFEGSFTIIGEKGTVRLGGLAANQIQTWDFADNSPGEEEQAKKHSYEISNVYGNSHEPFYQNVVDHLIKGTPCLVDAKEGARSIAFLDALYQSSREHRAIKVEELKY